MPTEYVARCTDCEIDYSGASSVELLKLGAPDECPTCGAAIEVVEQQI